jgi:hypothetical protein
MRGETRRGHSILILAVARRVVPSRHTLYVRSKATYDAAMRLKNEGVAVTAAAGQLGLPLSTIRHWYSGDRPKLTVRVTTATRCPRCADPPRLPDDGTSYAYLLGLYLGDGRLRLAALERVRGTPILWRDSLPIDVCHNAGDATMRHEGR